MKRLAAYSASDLVQKYVGAGLGIAMRMDNVSIENVSVQQLAELLESKQPPLLVDCREQWEWDYCRIAGARHLPMSELRTRFRELEPNRDIIVYCHHGIRSHSVAQFLLRHGFGRVANLAGGIDAWSLHVDPQVPRY